MVPTERMRETMPATTAGPIAARPHPASRSQARRPARVRFGGPALLAVSLLVTSAGCSNNGKDQSSALCTARDHLVSSVQAVRDVDLASGGLDALRAALADVKTALDDVDQAAHEEFGDEVAAIRASFDQLSTTLSSLPNQPSVGAGVTAVSTAAAGLTASIQTLADQLKSGCD